MPQRAPRPCSKPGCSALANGRYCAEHQHLLVEVEQERKAFLDKQRGNANARGYTHRWRLYRKAFLFQHPLCAECERLGRTMLATVVDHCTPHRGDMKLFWDTDNHQALCKPCHDRKTATEDSGFASHDRRPSADRG